MKKLIAVLCFMISVLSNPVTGFTVEKTFLPIFQDQKGNYFSLVKNKDEVSLFDKMDLTDPKTPTEIKEFYRSSKEVFEGITIIDFYSCDYNLWAVYSIKQESSALTNNQPKKGISFESGKKITTVTTTPGSQILLGSITFTLEKFCPVFNSPIFRRETLLKMSFDNTKLTHRERTDYYDGLVHIRTDIEPEIVDILFTTKTKSGFSGRTIEQTKEPFDLNEYVESSLYRIAVIFNQLFPKLQDI